MSKADAAAEFHAWFDQQEIPAGYDRQMLRAYSIGNACDVPVSEIVEVAQATFAMYLDQEDFAREVGMIA